MANRQCWLLKTEPGAYSIADLEHDRQTCWDGVRNYQARNYMREMQVGDPVLIHHSGAEHAALAGLARVCREAYPDHTALDRKGPYHDPKATAENPIWMMVDIEFVEEFPRFVALAELKRDRSLAGMALLQRGQRLSVMPVSEQHFERVVRMGRGK